VSKSSLWVAGKVVVPVMSQRGWYWDKAALHTGIFRLELTGRRRPWKLSVPESYTSS